MPRSALALLAAALAAAAPARVCQASLVGLGAGILALTLFPAATKKHLLDYGARDGTHAASDDRVPGAVRRSGHRGTKNRAAPAPAPDALERTVAAVVAWLQVPHAWFVGFYVFYLACSAFWAAQWWRWQRTGPGGPAPDNWFGRIVASQNAADQARGGAPPAPSMALVQVYAALVLEALQAGRRTYEYLYVFRPSKATMNVAHFLLGFLFYGIVSVAVWVEGSQAILAAKQHDATSAAASALAANRATWTKLAVGTPLFLLAWAGQLWCHVHLAGLPKYSLPGAGLFRYVVSPHYTCELALYAALSLVTAPAGRLLNQTVLMTLPFILAGLGVTADRTRRWYGDKFGAERVAARWRMLPFVF